MYGDLRAKEKFKKIYLTLYLTAEGLVQIGIVYIFENTSIINAVLINL